MQRGPEHQAQIAQVGRGEREFTERDARAMAADNRAFALSERFVQHTRHILAQWGQPQADGHLAMDTDQYHLRGSPDGRSFSVTTTHDGKPLLQVDQGTLSHVTITPNDSQRFETLGAQAQQEQLRAQHSHSPSHEVSR